MDIHITDHAYRRAKERLGLKKKSLDRMSYIAIEDGIGIKHINNGALLNYILSRTERYHDTEIIVHGEVVYVFSKDNVLITVFSIPQRLKKTNNQNQKRKRGKYMEI